MKTVAVILSGCGYRDGSEIRESVGLLWALSRHDLSVEIFAPDAPQVVVTNHYSGKATGETRNMLIEAARIARGKIRPLSELAEIAYDAILIPGGFGVATNLCTFAAEGAKAKILFSDITSELRASFKASVPICAVCIAPALVALALKGEKLTLTLGAEGAGPDELRKLSHTHVVTKPSEICIDEPHRIVTTPAYMYDDAPLNEVFEGIQKAVDTTIGMM